MSPGLVAIWSMPAGATTITRMVRKPPSCGIVPPMQSIVLGWPGTGRR